MILFSLDFNRWWQSLLPGFTWPLIPGGFLIGLLWLVGYSVYVAIIIAVPYNFFVQQKPTTYAELKEV